LQWFLGAGEPGKLLDAAAMRVLTHVLRSDTSHQVLGALRGIFRLGRVEAEQRALQEAQSAIEHVLETSEPVELAPQPSRLRRLQHQLVNQYELHTESVGVEPKRRARISK
jgi:predicted RNA-binding protein Jag